MVSIDILIATIVAAGLTLILVPIVHKMGDNLNIVAQVNERTVHKGRMVRIGGVAIYTSFMITSAIFLKADQQVNALLIGGFIVMISGLLDDLMDLKPLYKTLFQLVAALVVIVYGNIQIKGIPVPFEVLAHSPFMTIPVTLLWIIGITNAINLLDGLDGLASGVSAIMFTTIAIISMSDGRTDIAMMSMILAGCCFGFLKFNFHPARIFLGDVGALFLGFMIAVVSLLGFGFKSTTFIGLLPPVIILAIPIIDTFAAILRRRLKGQKASEADRGHLHHVLMYKLNLGHRHAVLMIYLMTGLFASSAILMTYSRRLGFMVLGILLLMMELMIEYTGMVNPRFHPILSLFGFRRLKDGRK